MKSSARVYTQRPDQTLGQAMVRQRKYAATNIVNVRQFLKIMYMYFFKLKTTLRARLHLGTIVIKKHLKTNNLEAT